jgi:hypothetical protein
MSLTTQNDVLSDSGQAGAFDDAIISQIADAVWDGNLIDGDYVRLPRRCCEELVRSVLEAEREIRAFARLSHDSANSLKQDA